MKQEQQPRLTLVRETVVQRTVNHSPQAAAPDPKADPSGLIVRTDLNAGVLPLLLAAGLLGNGAAAGGGANPS